MVRVLVCVVMIAALSSTALAQMPVRDTGVPAPTGTAVIRGRVVVAGEDRPLSRVEVRAISVPVKINQAALTDGSGRYEISGLPAGRYTVSFSRVNYVRATYGQRRPLGPGALVHVASGQIAAPIDIALQRTGVISGRILDEFGDAVVGVRVLPMRYAYFNGVRRMQPSGPMAISNDLGEYRLHGLVPGRYFISATSTTFAISDTTDRTAYAPTYYPGTGNVAEAQRFIVGSGQSIAGIDLTLRPGIAVRVSGIVFDSRGRPAAAGANVELAQRLAVGISGSSSAATRADGTFTIGGVAPGDYVLRAWLPATPDDIAEAELTVTTSDIGDVQLTAVKASTLRGRVVFEAGETKPPAPTAVRVGVLHPDSLTSRPVTATAGLDGSFEIKSSAGRTVLQAVVVGNADWRLKRVTMVDGADVTDTGFDVATNATVERLFVELTARHAELSGTVIDAAGAKVRDCVVVLFAQDQGQWTREGRHFGVGRPDPDYVYKVRLPAGDYYAVAFELDDQSVALNDPDILQQLRERSTKVTIVEGEKKTLSLTVSEPPIH